jgi:hypothetical protein
MEVRAMKTRRLLQLVPALSLLAVLATSPVGARPPETVIGGPEGAPNLTKDPTLPLVAQWATTKTRYVCVDYDGGNDLHRGYVEATTGSTLTTCPTLAVKTLAKATTLVPSVGNNRSLVMLIKPRAAGATYRNALNTADEGLDLSNVAGYSGLVVRASDLTNSTSDGKELAALVAVAGPGGSGSYSVAAGGTTQVFTVSAGSLGSTDADVGWRWRFDILTTTAALRDVSCSIAANTATQVTCGSLLGTAPVLGDTGFVERPAVRMASWTAPRFGTVESAGIDVTGTASGNFRAGAGGDYSFWELNGNTTTTVLRTATVPTLFLNFSSSYQREDGTFPGVGSGIRANTGVLATAAPGSLGVQNSAFVHATAAVTLSSLQGAIGSGTCYFANGASIQYVAPQSGTGFTATVGGSASTRRMRVVGGTLRLVGYVTATSIDITNATTAAITLGGSSVDTGRVGRFVIDDVVGSTGNTGVGIDGSTLYSSDVIVNSATTVTGTSGDLKLAVNVTATAADLLLSNVVDANGTQWHTSGNTTVAPQAFALANKSGGTVGVGSVVKSNGTTGQFTCAQATTSAAASAVVGVAVTSCANNNLCYVVAAGTPYVLYDGAPTIGAIAYLSPGTACKATTTVPVVAGTNQKLRLGRDLSASGSTGYTSWASDWLAVVADGNP